MSKDKRRQCYLRTTFYLLEEFYHQVEHDIADVVEELSSGELCYLLDIFNDVCEHILDLLLIHLLCGQLAIEQNHMCKEVAEQCIQVTSIIARPRFLNP